MSVILGKNITLTMTNGLGAEVRIGAARTVKFSGAREMKETSNSTSGRFKTFIAGMVDQKLSISGLMNFSNGSQYDYTDLYTKLVAAGTNLISFQFKEDNGTYIYTYSGQAIIASFERTKQYNDAGAYDVELQVSGEVTVTTTGTSIPYYWTTSPTPLTGADFVALIETGSVQVVSGPSYASISINFGVPSGAYLYFAIPATSPDRLSFYVSMSDSGRIGIAGDLFTYSTIPVTIGSGSPINYKVYVSSTSKVNNTPMDLRTFYPSTSGIIGYGTTVYDTYTASGTEGNSFIMTAAIGVQLNKLVVVLRGGYPSTEIITTGTPTGSEVKWDYLTGTLTFADPLVATEKITLIRLS